jgi:mRNA-degrading endonuclease YafQ of YafQ-DinJ toxin-antitoxin module
VCTGDYRDVHETHVQTPVVLVFTTARTAETSTSSLSGN